MRPLLARCAKNTDDEDEDDEWLQMKIIFNNKRRKRAKQQTRNPLKEMKASFIYFIKKKFEAIHCVCV